jgi:outer membrane protein OmpA-like peptidoglycan-associated protein/tetratricopeptide (TPR) repeat protein
MNLFQKSTLLLLTFLLLATAAMGQSSKLKRAAKYMRDLNYSSAIEVYNQVLEKHKDNAEAKINLAECYRKIGDAYNIEYWYGQVVQLPQVEPIHKLYYGMALQRNGKCDQAKPWYDAYLEAIPNDNRAQHLARACDYEEELKTKNAGIFQVRNLPFNSDLDDFSPAMQGEKVIFASERDRGAAIKREHTWTGSPFNELYMVDVRNETNTPGAEQYSRPQKYSSNLNSKYHDAAVTFTNDGSEIYYTRNNITGRKVGKDDQGITRLKVFVSKSTGADSWADPEGLPFNSDEYSVAHPCLNPDASKLFFSSDMPGGFGGMDLYYSEYESGNWGPPINMGNKINTEGNEIFPTWQGESSLYFSSDGHIGLGGLDIYRSKWNEEESTWSDPENLGAPLNSSFDDLGIVLKEDGTFGYFSSDRPGGQGRDDVYSFVKIAAPVEVYVFDELTKNPVKGATVNHTCAAGDRQTNKEGIVSYEIKLNSCCDYTATLEGYDPNTVEGCTAGLTDVPVRVEIPLKRSIQLNIRGYVYDQQTGFPLVGATVTMENDCEDTEPIAIVTDSTGFYTFPLRRDCCYKVKAEKQGYLASTLDNQCTKGLTEDFILEGNLYLQPTVSNIASTPDQRPRLVKDPVTGLYIDPNNGQPYTGVIDGVTYEKGKIVAGGKLFETSPTPFAEGEPIAYLLHIYYDFDRANIRDEALPELNKLLSMLNENPMIIVELASHTDARGSHRYNKRLSQRRADAVVDWLVEKGVNLDRLVPRGYGETVPVNDCVNNVPCNEKKHQLNRRTEFRILGCIGCVDPAKAKLSKPNENPQVDECKHCPF